jgi:hypothetical protein
VRKSRKTAVQDCALMASEYSQVYSGGGMPEQRHYTTHEAAHAAGISKSTLLRWIKEQRVEDVRRDRNNWRVFSETDIRRIRELAQ